ncbi:MAG: sugar transferase [Gammaproteobacteria bacterium]
MSVSKRSFDILIATFGVILCIPVFLVVAATAKLKDRGPVFFRQERIGLGGRPFHMWKFRSMVQDAAMLGGQLTVEGDPRITRIGGMLRKYKLDELPQLLNVLIGHMSLVGPRPEVAKYVALYNAEQRKVLDLMPGITDPASIAYRDESRLLSKSPDPERLYMEIIMPEKIRINLEYAQHATLWSDMRVMLLTLRKLLA